MGHVPIAPVVFGSILLLILSAQTAFAQHPRGIVLCEVACSKFDEACQGRCLPRGLERFHSGIFRWVSCVDKKLRQSAGFILGCDGAGAPRPSSVRLASLRKMFLNLAKACSMGSRWGCREGETEARLRRLQSRF